MVVGSSPTLATMMLGSSVGRARKTSTPTTCSHLKYDITEPNEDGYLQGSGAERHAGSSPAPPDIWEGGEIGRHTGLVQAIHKQLAQYFENTDEPNVIGSLPPPTYGGIA